MNGRFPKRREDATGRSDADFIARHFADINYLIRVIPFNCTKFGSFASRERIYIVAFDAKDLPREAGQRILSDMQDRIPW